MEYVRSPSPGVFNQLKVKLTTRLMNVMKTFRAVQRILLLIKAVDLTAPSGAMIVISIDNGQRLTFNGL